MDFATFIPMVGQLLTLGFKIANIIEKAENVSPEDKIALKEQIKAAQQGVTYWTDTPRPEDGPVPDNN